MAPRLIEIIGSLNIDLVSVTSRIPGPGETLAVKDFFMGFGGKGANQALAAARLSPPGSYGSAVRMIGAVGNDQFGDDFLRHLEKEGIDHSAVTIKDNKKTGIASIIVEEATGENRILISAGANESLRGSDIILDPKQDSVVVFQHEVPKETVLEGLRIAKAASKETVLNPAPAFFLPDEAFRGLTHLIMNKSEAALLSGIPYSELSSSLDKVGRHFLQLGVTNVVITLGGKGIYWQNTVDLGSIMPARKVKVVDTTAAGDTFVGAYTVYLAAHGSTDIRSAIDFANRAASMAVQKQGAQTAVPYLNEVPLE